MTTRPTRLRSAVAVILTALVLVPTSVLFTRVWQENSDQRDRTDLEKSGVEYITTLSPLISALAESQSSALQGVKEPPRSLASAVSAVSAADTRLGDSLRTRERWTGLQARIGKLSKAANGALAVYQAHVEVTDLALALYSSVRRNAGLSRDPDSDISNLQQAVSVDMPTTVVRVSRMGDLANILQAATGTARQSVAVQFGEEVLAVQDTVNRLTENLQAAVDNTRSPTLSGSLVSTLDSFRRGVESMTRGANPGGTPNAAVMSTAQAALETALSALAGVTLKEMAKLLDDRSDTLDYRRAEAIGLAVLAVLLVLGALIWGLGRRRPEPAPTPAASTSATGTPPQATPGHTPYDLPPAFGAADPTRREQSGALR
jgi:hypothetical protein